MTEPAQSASPALSQGTLSQNAPLPNLACACATILRTARLVTQLYSHEIGAGTGNALEPQQFALLSAFEHRPGLGQTPLGKALGLDKTTLSRNLRLLQKNGWIAPTEADPATGARRSYKLTPAGEAVLAAAKPGWMRAQNKLRAALAAGEWESTLQLFGLVAKAARTAME
jgi:DNA-binding MarR family transcriptional regulator